MLTTNNFEKAKEDYVSKGIEDYNKKLSENENKILTKRQEVTVEILILLILKQDKKVLSDVLAFQLLEKDTQKTLQKSNYQKNAEMSLQNVYNQSFKIIFITQKGIYFQDYLKQQKNEMKEKQNIYKEILDVQVHINN